MEMVKQVCLRGAQAEASWGGLGVPRVPLIPRVQSRACEWLPAAGPSPGKDVQAVRSEVSSQPGNSPEDV